MSKLDTIREHLSRAEDGLPYIGDLLIWYRGDVALLLQLADAALAYRAATQVPDGVAAAEQALFEVLDRLEKPYEQ